MDHTSLRNRKKVFCHLRCVVCSLIVWIVRILHKLLNIEKFLLSLHRIVFGLYLHCAYVSDTSFETKLFTSFQTVSNLTAII